MSDRSFECPELVGKTIQALRVYRKQEDGDEIFIDFTDGTSFSCCLQVKSALSASLFRASAGTPDIICTYES